MRIGTVLLGTGAMLGVIAYVACSFFAVVEHNDIYRLRQRVSCLEHPHAESSIAVTRINGRYVVTQPAHRTGCP